MLWREVKKKNSEQLAFVPPFFLGGGGRGAEIFNLGIQNFFSSKKILGKKVLSQRGLGARPIINKGEQL